VKQDDDEDMLKTDLDEKKTEGENKENKADEDESDDDGFVDDEVREAKNRWRDFSDKLCDKFVKFVTICNSDAKMVAELRDSPSFSTPELAKHENHLHLYNGKTEGECKTQPHLRYPVNRQAYMARALKWCMKLRCPDLTDGDDDSLHLTGQNLYMFMDSFKHDNQIIYSNCFQSGERKMKKEKTNFYLTYEESSMLKRRMRHRESLKQDVVEQMSVVSLNELELKPRKRLLNDNSSNQMNHIGPLVTTDPTDPHKEWLMTIAEKRILLGDTRKDSGGAGPRDKKEVEKKPTDKEPVSLHGNSVEAHKEIIHSFWGGSYTELTVQNENAAYACICMKIPYTGIVNNEFHGTSAMARLKNRVFRSLTDESCEELFEPMAVSDMYADGKKAGDDDDNEGEESAESEDPTTDKPKGRPKGRPKAKAKEDTDKPKPKETVPPKPKKDKEKATGEPKKENIENKLASILKKVETGGDPSMEATM